MMLVFAGNSKRRENNFFRFKKEDRVPELKKSLDMSLLEFVKLRKWFSLKELNGIHGNTKITTLMR